MKGLWIIRMNDMCLSNVVYEYILTSRNNVSQLRKRCTDQNP